MGEAHFSIVWSEDSAGAHHGVSGAFIRDPQPVPPSGACTTEEIDGCTLVECPPIVPVDAGAPVGSENDAPTYPPEAGTSASYASAGIMTISGLLPQGQGSIVIGNPPPYPLFYQENGQRKLWDGGEPIAIDFSGDAVPPMHQTITAPTPVQLTTPMMHDGLVADRTSPFDVAWSGTSAGSVKIFLQLWPLQTLICMRDASSGATSITPATLSHLGSGTANLEISFVDAATLDQGGWTLTTTLETYPSGTHFAQIQLN